MTGSLPELPNPQGHEMPAGPTPWSNWVIPGRVLAGAYPASLNDAETEQLLSLLLELGVNTFVCLQAEVNIHIPEHSWRAGLGLRPYVRDAQRLLSRAQETGSSRIPQRKIDFLHLPVIDGSVTTDSAMSKLADDCCDRVLRGETMYIHCWGGHGRTGTLVAVMLGRLYSLPASAALRLTQAYHDTRIYPQGVRSPQTTVQRAQVKRLLMLPNAFAGANPAAGSVPTIASRGTQQQQQQLAGAGGSTAAAAAAAAGVTRAAGFSPTTPVKQQTSIRGIAAVAAAASATSAARVVSGAATTQQGLARSRAAAAAAGASSSPYQPRLLQHQHTSPVSAAAAVTSAAAGSSPVRRAGSFSSSISRGTAGSSSSGGSSGSGSRQQQWPLGAAAVAAGSSSSGGNRVVQAAAAPLLRSDVLRTPLQARLVQPVSHRG